MSVLLKELGKQDEENYIYLDKDGKAQTKVELSVQWEKAPTKRILVTCNSSDSLSYLRCLIGEVMEKFSIFSGLSNLQATSLYLNKQELPESGLICDYLNSGNHLSCEISSLDIWLEVKIEAIEFGLLIFLEIKVYKNKKLSQLKKSLVNITNQVLKSKQFDTTYEDSEAEVQKIDKIDCEDVLGTEKSTRIEKIDTNDVLMVEVDESSEIGKVLNYLNRFIYVKLSKDKSEECKIPILTHMDVTGSESLSQISCSSPVRNLKVDVQIVKKNSNKSNSSKEGKSERYPRKQYCNCLTM